MTLDRRGLENEMRGARRRKLISRHFIKKFQQQHERLARLALCQVMVV